MRVVADFPRLVAEWHRARNLPETPERVNASSYQPIWWKCPRDRKHVYQASPWERAYGGGGCSVCGDEPAPHAIRFAERFPAVAHLWHPTKNRDFRPEDLVKSSSCRVWWKCPHGPDHEWSTTVDDCTRRKNGCPFCAGRRLSVTNALSRVAPDLAKQWHPTKNGKLTPDRVLANAWTPRWWKCPKGADHVWLAAVGYRVRKQVGCPMCSSRSVAPSKSLAALEPRFARYWHPTKNGSLKPADVLTTSSRKVWWKCPAGADHEWSCTIKVRMRSDHPCPYCTGRKHSVTNSLQTKYPDIAAEWHPTKNAPVTAADVSPGAGRKYWWKCKSGHEWRTHVYNRTGRGSGCPVCAVLARKRPRAAAMATPSRRGRRGPPKRRP